jgi:RNA polymerase sigma-70 factor, ECF subfamily
MNQSASLVISTLSPPGPDALATERAKDEELVGRGDAASFAVLYRRHLAAVYGYVAARLPSPQEAEDATSDVFRRAWSSRRAYRGHGTVRAWIFAIARRTLADHYRRHHAASPLETAAIHEADDEQISPEEWLIKNESTDTVRRLLEQLSPLQQEILRLRFAAELTYAEIAVVIGKREDAVKKITYRALETLRRSLKDA